MSNTATKEKEFQQVANEYATSVIESMRDDLDALNHAQECNGRDDNGEECKRGSETQEVKLPDGRIIEQHCHEEPEAWHDEEAARRHIEEAPLSIEVRSDWHLPGEQGEPSEFNILLGTGGPALRIIGDLDRGQPTLARFEYQDWGKPWTVAQTTSEEDATMLEWAQVFYFGE
jgi:hypothetical protein